MVIRRTVEKSAEATMRIGDMQFLKAKTSITQDIEGEEAEVKAASDALWSEVAVDLRNGMWSMIKKLGTTTEGDKEFFEACMAKVQAVKAKSQPQKETQAPAAGSQPQGESKA